MNSRPLLLSLIALSAVGGLGLLLKPRAPRPPASPPSGSATEPVISPLASRPSAKKSPAASTQPITPREAGDFTAKTENLTRNPTNEKTLPSPAAHSPVFIPISEPELRRRAALVEQEANHDLKHLVTLLNLTDSQQDRIFDTLVRHAPDWHPAMQAGPVGFASDQTLPNKITAPNSSANTGETFLTDVGAAAESTLPLDEIAAALTPDQQDTLAESELDRQEWWAAILGDLEASLPTHPSISASALPPAGATGPEAVKASEDSGVLAE